MSTDRRGKRVKQLGTDAPEGTITGGSIDTGRWDVDWDDGTSGEYEGPQLQTTEDDS